jgi:hypothetical protein
MHASNRQRQTEQAKAAGLPSSSSDLVIEFAVQVDPGCSAANALNRKVKILKLGFGLRGIRTLVCNHHV